MANNIRYFNNVTIKFYFFLNSFEEVSLLVEFSLSTKPTPSTGAKAGGLKPPTKVGAGVKPSPRTESKKQEAAISRGGAWIGPMLPRSGPRA